MANMKDIAKLAGVSTATVSHVINDTRFVRKETRERVIKAMEELNYRPNFAARSLRTKKTKIIGIVLPDVNNLFYMDMVEGIDSVFSKNGYNIIVSNSKNNIKIEERNIEIFNSQLVDGLIIRPTHGDHSFLYKYSDSFPMVFLDCKPNNYSVETSVLSDNFDGSYKATECLIKKGHTRIGLINGIKGETTSDERFEGYKKALEDYGIDLDNNITLNGDYKTMSGYSLAKDILENSDATALFITNNAMTIGALRYIQESKITVPGELSVIGFDDSKWAELITPPLTVVRQQPFEMGTKAAKILLNKIRKSDEIKRKQDEHRFPIELVVRKSC